MNPANKALWYIEGHLAEPLALDEIAEIGGVSRFPWWRAFAAATGFSGDALCARTAADGSRTRTGARRAGHFVAGARGGLWLPRSLHPATSCMTPEAVRAATCLDRLKASEAILMDSTMSETLGLPVTRPQRPSSLPVSPSASPATMAPLFPGLWQRYHREVADIPARTDNAAVPVAYGVCCNGDDAGNIDYVPVGIEVLDFSDLPRRYGRIRIP